MASSTIITPMSTHRHAISMSASPGARIPKKNPLHAKFNAHCTANTPSAARSRANPPTRQTRHALTPINTYSVVQTGPNTQFGGFHVGFTIVAYQASTGQNAAAAQAPAVDDVTHQKQGVAFDAFEKFEQCLRLAARCAEVDV